MTSTRDRVRHAFGTKTINIPIRMAEVFGLNEAIVLQQIISWCEHNEDQKSKLHYKDGFYWMYNSYPEWQSRLPFWSESTIYRTIRSLEKLGLILSRQYNRKRNDQSKWYRPSYTNILNKLDSKDSKDQGSQIDESTSTTSQIDESSPQRVVKLTRSTSQQNDEMFYIINSQNHCGEDTAAVVSERLRRSAPDAANKGNNTNQPTQTVVLEKPKGKELSPPQNEVVASTDKSVGEIKKAQVEIYPEQVIETHIKHPTSEEVNELKGGDIVWFGASDGMIYPYLFHGLEIDFETKRSVAYGMYCFSDINEPHYASVEVEALFLMQKKDKARVVELIKADREWQELQQAEQQHRGAVQIENVTIATEVTLQNESNENNAVRSESEHSHSRSFAEDKEDEDLDQLVYDPETDEWIPLWEYNLKG